MDRPVGRLKVFLIYFHLAVKQNAAGKTAKTEAVSLQIIHLSLIQFLSIILSPCTITL